MVGEEKIFDYNRFTKFVLYAYSDFVHDKKNDRDFQYELENIKKNQEKLGNKCIIQNLFVIPHSAKEDTNQRMYILNSDIIKPFYTNVIFADKYNPDDIEEYHKRYHKIKYLTHKLYTNFIESCSPNLLFLTNKFSIRLAKPLKEGLQIHLRMGKKIIFLTDKFQSITNEKVPVQFGTHLPDSEISLDVAMDKGIHGILNLEFMPSISERYKWILPIFCLLSGCWVVIAIMRKIVLTTI